MSSSQSASSTDGDVARDRRDIRNALFKSLRPLPLMHNWVFWYDRFALKGFRLHGRYIPSADSNGYNDHLSEIAQFNTVPVVHIETPLIGRTFGAYTIIFPYQSL